MGGGGTNESLLSLGMNNDSYRGGGGGGGGQHRGSLTMMHASAQPPPLASTSSNMAPHNQGELFSEDQGSAVNSRQGVPNHYQQQQQLNMASSGGHGCDSINSLRKSDSTAPTSNRTSEVFAEDIDRRRVFAKMKYSRPPSDRSQHNSASQHRLPSQQQSQQQHQHDHQQQNLPQASQHSLGDGMPDIYMVESSLSLHSNLSTMTDGNSKKHLGSSSHHNMAIGGSNHHMTGSSSHMPGAGAGGGGSYSNQAAAAAAAAQLPAGVELGKVVDHSSRGIDSGSYHNHFPEMLGSGSRHSIMSGLSRISDTSLNEGGESSMFSDLSRKIGNVSTRSMAMSEISGIDLMREHEDEDNYDDDDDDDNDDDDDDSNTQDFAGEN